MKTTKRSAAVKRLAKATKSKTSIAYKVASDLLLGTKYTYLINGDVIRPAYTLGTGRFLALHDHTEEIQQLLSACGIDTVLSNDAPRGGVTGTKLTITTKII